MEQEFSSVSAMKLFKNPCPDQLTFIDLEGPDARDFLSRMGSADIGSLKIGHGCRNCFLQSNGRILSYQKVWRISENHYQLFVPCQQNEDWARKTCELIEKFHFSEDMTISALQKTAFQILISEPNDQPQRDPWTLEPLDTGLTVQWEDNLEYGQLSGLITGDASQISAWIAQNEIGHSSEDPEALRILSIFPSIDYEIREEVLPLEINLLSAISQQKGCYPGQEVIEKIISLAGEPPRKLVRFSVLEGTKALLPGEPLYSGDSPEKEVGRITNPAGLAIVKKRAAVQGGILATSGGTRLRIEALSSMSG